jgi:hypothetical protein
MRTAIFPMAWDNTNDISIRFLKDKIYKMITNYLVLLQFMWHSLLKNGEPYLSNLVYDYEFVQFLKTSWINFGTYIENHIVFLDFQIII